MVAIEEHKPPILQYMATVYRQILLEILKPFE